MKSPCFIDCEASSFSADSYPTEVGWSLPSGEIKSMLINPYLIDDWIDWDLQAQALTGISREMLRTEGHHPKDVALALNNDLRDSNVHSDAPDADEFWLTVLFCDTKIKMEFVVVHIWKAFQDCTDNEQQMWDAINKAEQEIGKSHRAALDVQRSLLAWRKLIDEPNR